MSNPNPIFRCHIRKSCFHSGKLTRRNRKYRNTCSYAPFSIAMLIYQSALYSDFFLLHLSRCSASLLRKVCPWILGKSNNTPIHLFFQFSWGELFCLPQVSGLIRFGSDFFLVLLHFGMSTKRWFGSWEFMIFSSRLFPVKQHEPCWFMCPAGVQAVYLAYRTLSIRTMFMFNNLSWNTEFSSHTAISSYQTLTFQIWWNISIFGFSSYSVSFPSTARRCWSVLNGQCKWRWLLAVLAVAEPPLVLPQALLLPSVFQNCEKVVELTNPFEKGARPSNWIPFLMKPPPIKPLCKSKSLTFLNF